VDIQKTKDKLPPPVEGYKNSELVLGLVCAVGTDLDKVIKIITTHLDFFNYSHFIIDVAAQILSEYNNFFKQKNLDIGRYERTHGFRYDDKSENKARPGKYEATHEMMDVGNALRRLHSGFIGMAIAERIQVYRKQIHGNNPPIELPKKAFIIKSLKNEAEVNILRATYGNGFYMFGVYSDKKKRQKNLKSKRMDEKSADDLIERDEDEAVGFGQHTRNTFQMADFFINYQEEDLEAHICRIIDLIFGEPFNTPTFGEYAMFSAYCASIKSADLKRQIGAVICKEREILASGANECPKYNGGQYWLEYNYILHKYEDDIDGKDYMLGYDSNKKIFQELATESFSEISGLLMEKLAELKCYNASEIKEKLDDIITKLKGNEEYVKVLKDKTGLGDLTEYGRVVHAEMEALSMCARNGISCRGGKLYCTTFPCHICTKHLIAAGITKVIYIEPYPKSKALELYKESISSDESEEGKKVIFSPFFGVGPRRYIELFSMNYSPLPNRERKDAKGQKLEWKHGTATVRDQMLPSTYLGRERKYAEYYADIVSIIKNNKC